MCQVYHSNAKTNRHVREIIQKSDLASVELANKYSINIQTVSKWRKRDFSEDKSSRPNTIHYTLSPLEKELIRIVRMLTWMEPDGLVDCVRQNIPKANRSNVYRILRAFSINQVPKEQKEKAKTFKEYKPGYLHNAQLFLQECKEYFPFYITHILTDNGLEFTDKFECAKENIEHRLTAPATPKTNGMIELANGTIKNSTIKATDYKNIEELKG